MRLMRFQKPASPVSCGDAPGTSGLVPISRSTASEDAELAGARTWCGGARSGAGEHGHIVPCPATEVLVSYTILVRDCSAERATWRRCCVSLNPCGVDVELHRGH